MIEFIIMGTRLVVSFVNGVEINDYNSAEFKCVYDTKSGKAFYLRGDGTHPNEVPSDRIGANLRSALENAS